MKDAKLKVGFPVWLSFAPSLCTGCAWCIDVCSHGVFRIKKTFHGNLIKKKVEIDITQCVNCGNCLDVCKPKAIINHSYNHIHTYLKEEATLEEDFRDFLI